MKNSFSPTLILFCGLPGSGKTTLAKQLEKQGKGIRLCTDDWQEYLNINHNDNNFHERLQRKLYEFALELLKHGQDIILEDGLWTRPERTEKLADAKEWGAHTVLHFFDISFDENWKRLQSRNQSPTHGTTPIDKEAFQKCWNQFQKPTPDELAEFDEVFTYQDGSKSPNC